MSRKRTKSDPDVNLEEGEQIPLIEVEAENSKELLRIARAYKRAQAARIEALEQEVKYKGNLLTAIKDAKLHPIEDGCYKVRVKDVLITVTPRDELVKVKEAGDEVPGDEVSA